MKWGGGGDGWDFCSGKGREGGRGLYCLVSKSWVCHSVLVAQTGQGVSGEDGGWRGGREMEIRGRRLEFTAARFDLLH